MLTPPHFLWTWSWAFCPQLDFCGWGHASPKGPPLRVSPQHCSVSWTMCPRTLPSPPSSWGHGGMEQPCGSCLESLQEVPWIRQPSLLSQLKAGFPSTGGRCGRCSIAPGGRGGEGERHPWTRKAQGRHPWTRKGHPGQGSFQIVEACVLPPG